MFGVRPQPNGRCNDGAVVVLRCCPGFHTGGFPGGVPPLTLTWVKSPGKEVNQVSGGTALSSRS